MIWPKRRRWWLTSLIGLIVISPESSSGQQKPPPYVAPSSLDDPRLRVIRQAGPIWESRTGPRREVIDQVCLVPDLATYFEAIGSWDANHFFPVLFDDVETSFRFIRAFQPARIVRMPRSAGPILDGRTWDKAVEAVGASWTGEARSAAERPRGETPPKTLGPTPPGVVLSSPDAPMLAGAVALAAGRFQPLVRLDDSRKFGQLLTKDEGEAFASVVTEKVKATVSNYDGIADDCDFLTIAGDWPFAYQNAEAQRTAVDDLIGRRANPPHRWAYAGRLLGNSKESAYRAMCSLFLQPDSALMFNTYEDGSPPWSDYSMKFAAARLNSSLKTFHAAGNPDANVAGWHEIFDPINRFGLVLINSQGSPTQFAVNSENASTSDIPFTVPAAILMIHSYSAADPNDPNTIAGRWLANGAFVYYGSMNEPFLQSFRTPKLVGDIIGEHLPLVVAVRTTLLEPMGTPWRLVFLGDPLYRIKRPSEARASRLNSWGPTASWPAYTEPARPVNGTSADLVGWAMKAALTRLEGKPARGTGGDDLIDTLLAIDRSKLPEAFRPIADALLIDILLEEKKRSVLRSRLTAIPPADRSPAVKRTLETLMTIDFSLTLARQDFTAARTAWRELMKWDGAGELKTQITARVGRLSNTPIRRQDWITFLRGELRHRTGSPEAKNMAEELKKAEEEAKKDR